MCRFKMLQGVGILVLNAVFHIFGSNRKCHLRKTKWEIILLVRCLDVLLSFTRKENDKNQGLK